MDRNPIDRSTIIYSFKNDRQVVFGTLSDGVLRHERLRLQFDDGRVLHYEDQRKFGRWELVLEGGAHPKIGLEPFSEDFTWEYFDNLLSKYHQKIKTLLLNQRYIAGLGNIYVDEALWEAKVHPIRPCDELTAIEKKSLFEAIPRVLMRAIENKGTSLGDHRSNYLNLNGSRGNNQNQLNVFRKEGQPCPRCGKKIVKSTVGQRGTHFCPCCQKV